MLGCYGKGKVRKFAEIVAATVLCGELSLGSAIVAEEWVDAHDLLGRTAPDGDLCLPGVLRLVTIPISHYCEKARWALDRAGIPYREERHVQGIHRIVARLVGRRKDGARARDAGGARSGSRRRSCAGWTNAQA